MSKQLQQQAETMLANEIKYQSKSQFPDEIGGMAMISICQSLDLITERQANEMRAELETAVDNRRYELRQERNQRILDEWRRSQAA